MKPSPVVRFPLSAYFLLPIMIVASSVGSQDTDSQLPPGGHETPLTTPVPSRLSPAWSPTWMAPTGVSRNGYESVQVNVDHTGANLWGDAANEPTIAVDPTAPNRMVIAWRQFDTVDSDFRTLGVAVSNDGGRSWRPVPSPDPGIFRTDPVLAAGPDGRFYLMSLRGPLERPYQCQLFVSDDGGRTWSEPIPAYGGDKPWMVVDTISEAGRGNLYASWREVLSCCEGRSFTRSTDGGTTFLEPIAIDPCPEAGTIAIGPDGEVIIGGLLDLLTATVARSFNAHDPSQTPVFESTSIDLGGLFTFSDGPNPQGLLGQVWIAADASNGPNRGNLYLYLPLLPLEEPESTDMFFCRSINGGETWSEPVAVPADERGTWQWFGTMSVAATGRIDLIWIESLDNLEPNQGELRYCASNDGGINWSQPVAITPSFDSHLGWPVQQRLGDYYHMVSDSVGADLAYAATFNGEQDIYYLRLGDRDCNQNGVPDATDLAAAVDTDCNNNLIPDSCELAAGTLTDNDSNGVPDECRPAPEPRRPSGRVRPMSSPRALP